jgi:hypothetical protein
MAKKASSNATTTWILLSEARERVVRAYDGAEQRAERLLVEWLGEKKVRWSCKRFEGPRAADLAVLQREAAGGAVWWVAPTIAYSDGDPAFWRTGLKINWEENWAREQYVVGGASAYGIKASLEDLLAQLPEDPGGPEEATARSKEWIVEEARRLKRAGEISDGIRKSDFAKLIEKRMKEAVRAGTLKKSVGWQHIRNSIRAWDLWPVSRI